MPALKARRLAHGVLKRFVAAGAGRRVGVRRRHPRPRRPPRHASERQPGGLAAMARQPGRPSRPAPRTRRSGRADVRGRPAAAGARRGDHRRTPAAAHAPRPGDARRPGPAPAPAHRHGPRALRRRPAAGDDRLAWSRWPRRRNA
ncbi:hypothetical protein ACU686_29420 [Yinghuangia aomiensis]